MGDVCAVVHPSATADGTDVRMVMSCVGVESESRHMAGQLRVAHRETVGLADKTDDPSPAAWRDG